MPPKKVLSNSELSQLAVDLTKSPREKANNLPLLIHNLSAIEDDVQKKLIIQQLKLHFIGCHTRQENFSSISCSDSETKYRAWLQRQHRSYTAQLLQLLAQGAIDPGTEIAAFAALMETVRQTNYSDLDFKLYSQVLHILLWGAKPAPEVLGALVRGFLHMADVRYYTLKIIEKACRSPNVEDLAEDNCDKTKKRKHGEMSVVETADFIRTVHDILTHVIPLARDGELESWCGAIEAKIASPAADALGSRQRRRRDKSMGHKNGAENPIKAKWLNHKHHAHAFSNAWMAFLQLPLPDDIYRKVLAALQDTIIPGLVNPVLLADFLSRSLDRGGLQGMLALHSIFILVTKHGLEYSHFYVRLYGLLTSEAMRSRHRARFFKLADIFLASGMLPAYTAAAFAKRFARLALVASPAGSLLALAFVHNIIRRHPACMQMLHRREENSVALFSGHDPYDPTERNPNESKAIESTLWEVTALRQHAHPPVAAACLALEKDLSDKKCTAEVDLTEFLDGSYTALCRRELARRIKAVPVSVYRTQPSTLFENGTEDFKGWDIQYKSRI